MTSEKYLVRVRRFRRGTLGAERMEDGIWGMRVDTKRLQRQWRPGQALRLLFGVWTKPTSAHVHYDVSGIIRWSQGYNRFTKFLHLNYRPLQKPDNIERSVIATACARINGSIAPSCLGAKLEIRCKGFFAAIGEPGIIGVLMVESRQEGRDGDVRGLVCRCSIVLILFHGISFHLWVSSVDVNSSSSF